MDSLTQAVLGAACGEAVLGKKIGNKALIWGAIAGTIPDLDVVTQAFLHHEVDELVYHRGLTHSILFTIVAPIIFGLMGRHARSWLLTLFFLAILLFIGQFAVKDPNVFSVSIASVFAITVFWMSRKWFAKDKKPWENEPTVSEWSIMFFFAILTHWLIDACTSYGTQIFEPFSNYRVSFNNIAIVDPLYTVPLLLAVLALIPVRNKSARRIINWTGLTLSTLYMSFTFYAKSVANSAFSESLKSQEIAYEEFLSYPTMFNSLLWQATIISKDAYYYGIYSIMDKDSEIEFIKLPKNHELLDKYEDERYVKILKWFAQGYYNVEEKENGVLQINNLRFGLMGYGLMEFENPYIFKHQIYTDNNQFHCVPIFPEVKEIDFNAAMSSMWDRMWGE